MEHPEEISRMTVAMPASMKRQIKVNAAKNDRPLSKEVLNTLRAGLDAKAENATA